MPPLLDLAPNEACNAPSVAGRPVCSYHAFSPSPAETGSLFSVALSVNSAIPAQRVFWNSPVIARHSFRRSPDFSSPQADLIIGLRRGHVSFPRIAGYSSSSSVSSSSSSSSYSDFSNSSLSISSSFSVSSSSSSSSSMSRRFPASFIAKYSSSSSFVS